MAASTGNVWDSIIHAMPQAQPDHLRELTHERFGAGKREASSRFIRITLMDRLEAPRVVLWETHLGVGGLDADSAAQGPNIRELTDMLNSELPQQLHGLRLDLYFTSGLLGKVRGGAESLRLYLVMYCDKLYAVPQEATVNVITWNEYRRYFEDVRNIVLATPRAYADLCRRIGTLFRGPGTVESDELYRHLVLLRSLPESVAYSVNGYESAAAESTTELLRLLQVFEDLHDDTNNEVAVYSIVNALEWLAYLAPKMYAHDSGALGQPLHEVLVERLVKYITSDRFRLATRLEAAWALSWASVSSIPIAARVHEVFGESDIRKLNNPVLKNVAGAARLRASLSLASFGPARITPDAGKQNYPGGYRPADGRNPLSLEDALKAASDVVYSQLRRVVGGQPRVSTQLVLAAVAWLCVNAIVAGISREADIPVLLGLLLPPLGLVVGIGVAMTIRWGRKNRPGVIAAWGIIAAIVLVLYQVISILSGTANVVHAVCSWTRLCP